MTSNKIVIEISGKDSSRPAFDQATAGAKSLKYNMDGLDRSILKSSGGMSGLTTSLRGLAGAFGAFSAMELGRSILDAGVSFERLQKSLTAIEGSYGASQSLAFIRDEAERLGLKFTDLADSYKGLSAASKGTALEGEATRKIFTAIASAGSTLSMSNEQVAGSLLALSQMISKGKVSAEELRGQLGERLPGAFNIAAEAMGMTTAELDKLISSGDLAATDFLPRFADALAARYGVAGSADSATASINRLSNSVTDLFNTVASSGVLDYFSSRLDYISRKIGETKAAMNFDWGGQVSRGIDTFKNTLNLRDTWTSFFTKPASGSSGEFAQLERASMVQAPQVKSLAAILETATKATEKHAVATGRATKAARSHGSAAKGASAATKEFSKSQSEASQIMKEIQSPFQKVQSDIAQLDVLLKSGALGWDSYQKAVSNARKELSSSEGQTKFTNLMAGRSKDRFEDTYGKSGESMDAGIRVGGTINEIASAKWEDAWGNIDKTKDKFGELKDAINGWSKEAAGSIADFVMGTETSFTSMLQGIEKSLIAMSAQKYLTDPLFSSLSGGFSKLFAGIFHEGGVVGSATAMRGVSAALFAGAPRLHSGLASDEFPAILQKGETVIPRGGGTGSQTVQNFSFNTTVQMSGGGGGDAAQGQAIGEQVSKALESKVIQIIQTQMRPGNVLNRGMRG